jgi:hypothetical protein
MDTGVGKNKKGSDEDDNDFFAGDFLLLRRLVAMSEQIK